MSSLKAEYARWDHIADSDDEADDGHGDGCLNLSINRSRPINNDNCLALIIEKKQFADHLFDRVESATDHHDVQDVTAIYSSLKLQYVACVESIDALLKAKPINRQEHIQTSQACQMNIISCLFKLDPVDWRDIIDRAFAILQGDTNLSNIQILRLKYFVVVGSLGVNTQASLQTASLVAKEMKDIMINDPESSTFEQRRQYDRAFHQIADKLESFSLAAESLITAALDYSHKNDYPRAIACCINALELVQLANENNVPPLPSSQMIVTAKAWSILGRSHQRLGNNAEAVPYLENCIEIFEEHAVSYRGGTDYPLLHASAFTNAAFFAISETWDKHFLNALESLLLSHMDLGVETNESPIGWTRHIDKYIYWSDVVLKWYHRYKAELEKNEVHSSSSSSSSSSSADHANDDIVSKTLIDQSIRSLNKKRGESLAYAGYHLFNQLFSNQDSISLAAVMEVVSEANNSLVDTRNYERIIMINELLGMRLIKQVNIEPYGIDTEELLQKDPFIVEVSRQAFDMVAQYAGKIVSQHQSSRRRIVDFNLANASHLADFKREGEMREKICQSLFNAGLCCLSVANSQAVFNFRSCQTALQEYCDLMKLYPIIDSSNAEIFQMDVFRGDILFHLAHCYFKQGRLEEALKHAEQASTVFSGPSCDNRSEDNVLRSRRRFVSSLRVNVLKSFQKPHKEVEQAISEVGKHCVGPIEDANKEMDALRHNSGFENNTYQRSSCDLRMKEQSSSETKLLVPLIDAKVEKVKVQLDKSTSEENMTQIRETWPHYLGFIATHKSLLRVAVAVILLVCFGYCFTFLLDYSNELWQARMVDNRLDL